MPNRHFNKQVSNSVKSGNKPPKQREGVAGSERGPAQKDSVRKLPKPGPMTKIGFNDKVKFPVVKSFVVVEGLEG